MRKEVVTDHTNATLQHLHGEGVTEQAYSLTINE